MKKCPFCAEEIQDEALKCRFCNEFLDKDFERPKAKKSDLPWYFRNVTIITGILTVGPLMLPFVWFHPKYSWFIKITVTIVIVIIAWVSYQGVIMIFENFKKYRDVLQMGV